jgi:hypothetical protein
MAQNSEKSLLFLHRKIYPSSGVLTNLQLYAIKNIIFLPLRSFIIIKNNVIFLVWVD